MKKLLTILFAASALSGSAQKIMSFQEAEKQGIGPLTIDSIYLNAIPTKTFEGVFKGSKDFDKAWEDYWVDFYKKLQKSKFTFDKPTFLLNKLYFDEQGKLIYWYYQFNKSDNVSAEKQEVYLSFVKSYVKKNKLKLKYPQAKWGQCASTMLGMQ